MQACCMLGGAAARAGAALHRTALHTVTMHIRILLPHFLPRQYGMIVPRRIKGAWRVFESERRRRHPFYIVFALPPQQGVAPGRDATL